MDLQPCHSALAASTSIDKHRPSARSLRHGTFMTTAVDGSLCWRTPNPAPSTWKKIACAAAQESAAATVADQGEKPVATEKPKPPAPSKPAPKDLPDIMEQDVIPSLRSTLEGQEGISQIELSFSENRLEGSFLKKNSPYYFWAFFPDGSLTGPKGFSLSSYGSGVSTVEPFLIDEKRVTFKHVVFWVLKRLAAQGILPVWKE